MQQPYRVCLWWLPGSGEDKMRLLFTMYDKDKSGTLSKREVTEMIKYVRRPSVCRTLF